MFDCDSDRREYAHKQYVEFVARNSGEKPPAAPQTSSSADTPARDQE